MVPISYATAVTVFNTISTIATEVNVKTKLFPRVTITEELVTAIKKAGVVWVVSPQMAARYWMVGPGKGSSLS
jgi:transcription antitermination factor NusG